MPRTPSARTTFNAHKAEMIKLLGRKETEEQDLDKIGRAAFGQSWGGVHPIDRVKLKPNHYYIVNTDGHDKPGMHWLGLYTGKSHAYIYDSYARAPGRIAGRLVKNITDHGYLLSPTDRVHHMEQIGYTSGVCGQLSMAWLLTVQSLGIRRASVI
jgi:hypothetical protein